MSFHTRRDRVSANVVVSEVTGAPEVAPALADLILLIGICWCIAHEHVKDDLRVIIDQITALLDSSLNVDVVCSHAIHEDALAFPSVWREEAWDGTGGDGRIRQLRVVNVLLRPLRVQTRVDIGRSNRDPTLDTCIILDDIREEGFQGRVIDCTVLPSEALDLTEGPVDPDVAGVQVLVHVRQILRSFHLIADFEARNRCSVHRAC